MSEKLRIPVYLSDENARRLDQHYTDDGSRSKTAFIENAIRFYIDYLTAKNGGAYLPTSIKSMIEGRFGLFEDRLASLLFKQSVELDMAMSILAASFELDEEYLRRQRGRSAKNVKQTNGRLSFEEIVQRGDED